MPGGPQHILERRAEMLAAAFGRRVDAQARALRPRGSRPAFTEQKSRRDALAWWDTNIDNEYGQQALKSYGPLEQLDLKRQLQRYRESGISPEEVPDVDLG